VGTSLILEIDVSDEESEDENRVIAVEEDIELDKVEISREENIFERVKIIEKTNLEKEREQNMR
jgi:hypothetical protein